MNVNGKRVHTEPVQNRPETESQLREKLRKIEVEKQVALLTFAELDKQLKLLAPKIVVTLKSAPSKTPLEVKPPTIFLDLTTKKNKQKQTVVGFHHKRTFVVADKAMAMAGIGRWVTPTSQWINIVNTIMGNPPIYANMSYGFIKDVFGGQSGFLYQWRDLSRACFGTRVDWDDLEIEHRISAFSYMKEFLDSR